MKSVFTNAITQMLKDKFTDKSPEFYSFGDAGESNEIKKIDYVLVTFPAF